MEKNIRQNIALFTMAVGKDPIYYQSVRRYLPYNKDNFGHNRRVDYYLFTDREESIEGIYHIPCQPTVWPYTTLLKNNAIADFINQANQWDKYSHIFFIDADFVIGDRYDFFEYDFVLVSPYWNKKNGGGFFYGGKTEYFKQLCSLFYDEMHYIYENKLPLPKDLDEYYLGLFREQYSEQVHLIEMDRESNTLIFFDNEDLEEKIRQSGKRLFMQPYKAEGRANKTYIVDIQNKQQECIVNTEEGYIFNNYTYDFGRLLKINDAYCRIFWSNRPETREVLNLETYKISKQPTDNQSLQISPIISVVLPFYNISPKYLKDSIDSILKQTFGDFELLIIDDGSTDTESIDIVKTFHDPRIRLITNPHNFIDSLNRGIAESKGKYIARMDADDIMLPNRLQVQYDFMETNTEIDICGTWVTYFGNIDYDYKPNIKHNEIVSSFLLHNILVHPAVFLRKLTVCNNNTAIYQHGYDYAEDYKLWTDLAIRGHKFAIIPEVLLKYRKSDNQITSKRPKEMQQTSRIVQAEYAENVATIIMDKDEQFIPLFESLFEAVNNEIIDLTVLLQVLYGVSMKKSLL